LLSREKAPELENSQLWATGRGPGAARFFAKVLRFSASVLLNSGAPERDALVMDLSNMEEVHCPKCGKPLVVTDLPDGRARFDGCECQDAYNMPKGSIIFGAKGGLKTIYKPKAT
jgi:hypothetical protein